MIGLVWRRDRKRWNRGSATVELVAVTPFVLVFAAFVLDARTLVGFRTDLARETFALAEVIANETRTNPLAAVMGEAMTEFREDSAGTLAVAVVTRGTERGTGVPCVVDQWCLPRVLLAWPVSPDAGTWNAPGLCATAGTSLPAQGQHFPADQAVLPNENADGATPHQAWLSRNMRPTEWWVVVDTCLDPTPGLVWSRAVDGIIGDFFDLSGLIVRKRAAWGSVHDLADCNWCGTP
ncbi:MAG: hypothetical protein F4X36_04590 [Gammaproteobacteria bacterium]|nr:hypothetical protein [Gammaproteobacteria bacterium]